MATSPAIQRMRYRHDRIVDWLVMNPDKTQGDCARAFNYTEPWLSRIINSDVFQAQYQQRCRELGVEAVFSIANKLGGLAAVALERVHERVESGKASERFLTDTTKLTLEALGYLGHGGSGDAQQHQHLHLHQEVDKDYLQEVRERVLQRKQGTTALKEPDGDGKAVS